MVTTASGVQRTLIHEVRLLVMGLTDSGKTTILKALLGSNFETTTSNVSSSDMLFKPYQTLVEVPPNDDDQYGRKFIIKACDTRGLNDPKYSDEDTFETIGALYSSDFNLINHVVVCFKLAPILPDVHNSIVNLINYLKTAGYKSENICIALTFCDALVPEKIDAYINEMKKHPVVKDLFSVASKIFIAALPEISTVRNEFRSTFEEERDIIINNLISHLTNYVEPVRIFSHEQFQEKVLRHAKKLTQEQTESQRNEIDELTKQIGAADANYQKIWEFIKEKVNEGLSSEIQQFKEQNAQHLQSMRKVQQNYALNVASEVSRLAQQNVEFSNSLKLQQEHASTIHKQVIELIKQQNTQLSRSIEKLQTGLASTKVSIELAQNNIQSLLQNLERSVQESVSSLKSEITEIKRENAQLSLSMQKLHKEVQVACISKNNSQCIIC
ncbi:unnamed protein product [Didymodactylos carnosus]|uniref:Uncharacterized protein n=2 Tax=Didymodactylos carnosus TaxID=1234261 RepID=A0A814PUB3_9BILA|nr:unnamed protein product [Didymodactylos carnosus]CAF3875047.1 unnamed protein product [Didymodactylos carnosus]